MKTKFFLVFFAGALMGCKNESFNAPKDIAQKFEENIHLGKIEEAKKYTTEATSKMIEFGISRGKNNVDPDFTFSFIRDSISVNSAWVWYKNQKGKETREKLVKIDNKWLVLERQTVILEHTYYDSMNRKQIIKIKTKPY